MSKTEDYTPEIPQSFEEMDLSAEILRAVKDMGFTEPSTVQKKTIPLSYSGISNEITERILQDPERFAFGMAGLAEVLHCSIKTAYNYRSTGDYDLAIIRFGKRIIIDKVKATEIAQAQGKSRTDKPATI